MQVFRFCDLRKFYLGLCFGGLNVRSERIEISLLSSETSRSSSFSAT